MRQHNSTEPKSKIITAAKHVIQFPVCVLQIFLLLKQMGATKPKQDHQNPTSNSSR